MHNEHWQTNAALPGKLCGSRTCINADRELRAACQHWKDISWTASDIERESSGNT
jgi:hypothetical protein